jgi:F-type H+-transporting ATPase subunit delta
MQGSSRASLAIARTQLDAAAKASGADLVRVADDLFAVTGVLDANAGLRRGLTDPGRTADARSALVERLFGGKISAAAVDLLKGVAASRWSGPRDLPDATEALAVSATVIAADQDGQLGALEDELFRFERTIQGTHDLRDALADPRGSADDKAQLLQTLLEGKASAHTVRLARQAVLAPRGRRVDATLESYLTAAAARREQSVAHATVAAPLSAAHHDRLQASLSRLFGREIQLNVDIDPTLIGGLRVVVGDEVVDGSIQGRLEEARRRLAG